MAFSRTISGPIRILLVVSAVTLLTVCQEDTRPASFGLLCGGDSSLCEGPFTCLPTEYGQACTIQCADDSQCPTWYQSGRCAGEKVSTCVDFVCDPVLCR